MLRTESAPALASTAADAGDLLSTDAGTCEAAGAFARAEAVLGSRGATPRAGPDRSALSDSGSECRADFWGRSTDELLDVTDPVEPIEPVESADATAGTHEIAAPSPKTMADAPNQFSALP
jgi:hypothetical protein